MVTIPSPYRDTASLRGVHQQGLSVQANQFGEYVGQGLAVLAKGIKSTAEAIDYRDQLKAEADARQAANAYRDIMRSGLYDPQTGYLNQTGGNALDGQRTKTFETLAAARSNIEGSLSPRARKAFGQIADTLDNGAKDTAMQHEGVEFKSFTLQSFEASAQGFLDDAMLNFRDDKKFSDNVMRAEVELRNAAALKGDSPEAIQQQVEKLHSAAVSGRVIEIARTDPVAAYEYLQKNGDKVERESYNKLYEGLEPAYYAGLARGWVSKQGASAEASGYGDEDQYGVPHWLAQAESTNNPNAVSTAGATGRVQFLASTWMKYIERLKPAWAEGMSEQQLLEMRKDPAKEGEIYRAFRADNQAQLTANGFAITQRNEYMMHHYGGVGIALLKAEASGNYGQSWRDLLVANGINADEWISKNPYMAGKTVGAMLNWVSNHVSKAGGAVANPTLLMQQALEIEDPKLREATIKELQLRSTVAENVRNENLRIDTQAAWDYLDNGGAPSDIPPDLQARVGAPTMNEIFNAYERQQVGVDVTNEERHLELIDLATKSPSAFASLDLNDDRSNLSRADLLALKSMQADILGDQKTIATQGASAVIYKDSDYRSAMTDAQDQYFAAVGVKPEKMTSDQKAQYNAFTKQLRTYMANFANKEGRAMTFEERTNLVTTLLAPVIIDGVNDKLFGNDDKYLFDVPLNARGGYELQLNNPDVPPAEVDRITEALTATYGRRPSPDEITEQYENELLMSLNIDPGIEYHNIPATTRQEIFRLYPGASPEEVSEIFRQLMINAAKYSLQQGLPVE